MENLLNKFIHFHWKNYKGRLIMLVAGLLIILLVVILVMKWGFDKCWSELFWEVGVDLLATLFAFDATLFIVFLLTHNLTRHEDEIKASYLNSNLQEQYSPKGINKNGYRKTFTLHEKSGRFVVYVDDIYRQRKDNHLYFSDDRDKHFEPDLYIMMHVGTLYGAHAASKTVSELTVRLHDFKDDTDTNKKAVAYTTRSTYLAHLLTNRAIDYPLEEDLSVRKIYENTEYLTPLNRSKLSNHIGVNALLFLKGNILVLPRRGKDATVAKNGVTASIATRLNLDAYEKCFNKPGKEVDEKTISSSCVIDKLTSSLLIQEQYEEEMKLLMKENMHFLGLSRDPYEGGKPTLFYYINIDMTQEDFISKLNPAYKPEGIDSVHELLFVPWENIQLNNWEDAFQKAVEKKKKEKEKMEEGPITEQELLKIEDKEYDKSRLQFIPPFHYSYSKKEKCYTYTPCEKKLTFIFEQNLIANFWFYVNKDNDETQS